MKVRKLFKQLSLGELSNLSVGNEGAGSIQEAALPRFISYANEGLLRIYTRFILREKSVLVEEVEGVTHYHLLRQFAESVGSDEPHLYIKDLAFEPFEEDVAKILEVVEGNGRPCKLNDADDPNSLFTPYPGTLQVPDPVPGKVLGIIYQAYHAELVDEGENFLEQEIFLPKILEPALQAFVAHKAYGHMNGQENIAKGVEYSNVYEALCLDIEKNDIISTTWATSHRKLEDRGFV